MHGSPLRENKEAAMAYIRQRGDSYVVRYEYKDHRGETQDGWESFSTDKEAKRRKKEIEYEQKKGTFLAPTTVTVEELLNKWLEITCVKHKWTPKTYISNRSTIQNLICPYIGKMNVQKVTAITLEELYLTLSNTPCGLYAEGQKRQLNEKQSKRYLSGTTIHDVHRLLRTAFDYAVEWKLVLSSPVPKDAPHKTTEERAIWDKQSMVAALDSMKDNPLLHLAVHMTLVGSLREGELLGITKQDLDFEANRGAGSFMVNKTMQRVDKEAIRKVDRGQILYTFDDKRDFSKSALILKATKTDASTREIYMTPPLKAELQKWIEQLKQDEEKYGDRYHKGDMDMLFRLPDGKVVEPTLIRKWFEQWQDKHPEFKRIVFHSLRHSSATYYLMISDGDIKAVQGNTGHAQAGTLVNVYAHIQQESRRELAQKFSKEFYLKEESKPTERTVLDAQALLQLLQNADPLVKKQLALALFS
jgi:integrase